MSENTKTRNDLKALQTILSMLPTAENPITDKKGNRSITILYADSLAIRLKLTEDFALVNDSIKSRPIRKTPKLPKQISKKRLCRRCGKPTHRICPEHSLPNRKLSYSELWAGFYKRTRYEARKAYFSTAKRLGFVK